MEEMLSGYGIISEDASSAAKLINNSFGNIIESDSDKILHDARYDYLGRVDYIRMTDRLFREESEYGKVESRDKWISGQRSLLADHDFFTQTALLLRSVSPAEQALLLQEYGKEMK
ncbi:MAG: hypothetical protein GYA43_09875 [Bacteroidales bacterium]|nr:hypothetical protein [Bacteroidales bacterium]